MGIRLEQYLTKETTQLVYKHKKRYLTFYVIRQRQIKKL